MATGASAQARLLTLPGLTAVCIVAVLHSKVPAEAMPVQCANS